jgi:hypothetical protein
MKKIIFALLALVVCACSDDGPVNTTETIPDGHGRIRVVAFDAPTENIDHIYLHVVEVNLKTQETAPWITLSRPDTVIDFLDLVNGINVIVADTIIPTGTYTQLRLVLGDGNSVVADGETFPLKVPSGQQSGVKINLNFSLANREVAELYVDFDASKSVKWNPGQKLYMMHPTFKAYKRTTAGAIMGTVRTTGGLPLANARVEAVSTTNDTIATLTGLNGMYVLYVPAATYTVTATSGLYPFADNIYTNLTVNAGVSLTGYDFVLR